MKPDMTHVKKCAHTEPEQQSKITNSNPISHKTSICCDMTVSVQILVHQVKATAISDGVPDDKVSDGGSGKSTPRLPSPAAPVQLPLPLTDSTSLNSTALSRAQRVGVTMKAPPTHSSVHPLAHLSTPSPSTYIHPTTHTLRLLARSFVPNYLLIRQVSTVSA